VSAPTPTATNWVAVTNAPVTLKNQATVTLAPIGSPQHFRLRYTP
jgi:hypothetical protein